MQRSQLTAPRIHNTRARPTRSASTTLFGPADPFPTEPRRRPTRTITRESSDGPNPVGDRLRGTEDIESNIRGPETSISTFRSQGNRTLATAPSTRDSRTRPSQHMSRRAGARALTYDLFDDSMSESSNGRSSSDEDMAEASNDSNPFISRPRSRATPNFARRARRRDPSSLEQGLRFDSLEALQATIGIPIASASKRSRESFEGSEANSIPRILIDRGAVAVMMYRNMLPNADANDIWPNFRSHSKMLAQYSLMNREIPQPVANKTKRRVPVATEKLASISKQESTGRPEWKLPVELVELIARYLNRDDIKSLRMVSKELNYYISQVIFQTVVVPFNTEIYGMLAQGQKPDTKGKKRAEHMSSGYSWKNTNGDEVYNGHGLDVFKGFGKHILKYGMSFEVNEESLAQPPVKSLTEKKTSFWGDYDWPFEEYRRFDDVAGLESAADETPRMKIAFSELTKVKELALSVDSGLGWLNGPDRSIRARIVRNQPAVFGTSDSVPDRRAQAQQELWDQIEARHVAAGEDVKLATLYRLDAPVSLSETEKLRMLAEEQPEKPYLHSYLIQEATPHETNDLPVPTSFDDPVVVDLFTLKPTYSSSGILFTSTTPPTDAGHIMSPVIPAELTKAQKEWLLETEWAQRAFISSYMLSIIDNPITFTPVHTLNLSRISDRYLPMLHRADFWDALPNLKDLTIKAIPGWRNVTKDEAGFVETRRISPVHGLNAFCDLLSDHVAHRTGIRNLTLGWIGGGEHAEGLHARNKLLLPAPIIFSNLRNDTRTANIGDVTELEPDRLHETLLRFPHVEQLTLNNGWITPAALLKFVKLHDDLSLKHLCLDSISLTAILRTNQNGNHVAQVPLFNMPVVVVPPNGILGQLLGGNAFGNNNAGGQTANQGQAQAQAPPLLNNGPILNWLTQTLQFQTQHLQQMQQPQGNANGAAQQNVVTNLAAQVQAQMQQLQLWQHQQQLQNQPVNQNLHLAAITHAVTGLAAQIQAIQPGNIPPPAAAQQTPQPPANPQSLLQRQPREGSWTSIIDIISPGTNLADFDSDHSKADPSRQTSLESIEFISCGYAKLPHTAFDQAGVDRGNRLPTTPLGAQLAKRATALAPAMMPTKWPLLGEIVQDVDAMELAALEAGWALQTGWTDAEAAHAAEFDGCLPGGTGRFTGKLQRSDRVQDGEEAGSTI